MLLITNAKIYTLDPGNPMCSSILVDRGAIRALGSEAESIASESTSPTTLDLAGRSVLPGLIDAHIHLEKYALNLQKVDCETETRLDCLHRVAERARTTPPGEWILGHGWNQNNWEEGFGTADDLDQITTDHPVYLTAKSLHAGWANSSALRHANVTASTPDPLGGVIGRDTSGRPNGILFESAMEIVSNVIPVPDIDQIATAIRAAQNTLWEMGLTGVHDFDRDRCFSALQVLHGREQLHLRVIKSIPIEDLSHAIQIGLRSGFGDAVLRIGGVKAFADGALGPRTAAMLQPYDGDPENQGMLLMDSEELAEKGRLAVKHGLSLAVHAIGDRANHEVLNAYEQIRNYEVAHGLPGLRHRIEHVQLIHPQDAARLARLSIVASMQPIHATSDMLMADRYWGSRARFSYAWRTQQDHGAVLAFGSDAPVESPNPFWGIHSAVTRQRVDGTPGPDGWFPEQRLSLNDALKGFTYGAAYASGQEAHLGRLSPGYLADLIVLDQDPFHCAPDELRYISPTATMVAGDWVHRRI